MGSREKFQFLARKYASRLINSMFQVEVVRSWFGLKDHVTSPHEQAFPYVCT